MNAEVRNNPTEYRYEVWADGEMAGYTQYALLRGRIAFLHTEVYESFEGMGLGGRLARAALDDARARGLVVVPYCPFIAAYIERHLDEYRDLVAPEMLSWRQTMSQKPSADREELAISHARPYTAPGVRVFYDRGRCLHFAECVRGLPEVFDVEKAAVDPAGERLRGAGSRGGASLPERRASLPAGGGSAVRSPSSRPR